MKDLDAAKSILRLDNLYIDHIDFNSTGKVSPSDIDPSMQMEVNITGLSHTSFSAKIVLHIECEDFYKLNLSTTGIFSIESGITEENLFYQDNAVAIMFPYLRSQITLLTTQPNMKPIVLPPINIHAMLSNNSEKQ